MVALPVPDILETWTMPFLRDRPDLTADWLEQARLTVDDKPLVAKLNAKSSLLERDHALVGACLRAAVGRRAWFLRDATFGLPNSVRYSVRRKCEATVAVEAHSR
jgi:hypothetical protein